MATSIACLAPFAHAQGATVHGTLVGVAWDSVHHTALAGAIVQLVPAGEGAPAPQMGVPRTVTTGADGWFAFDSLAAGHYELALHHRLLEAMSLPARAYPVAIHSDTLAVIVSVPSPASLLAQLCSDATAVSAIAGSILDAATLAPIPGVAVEVAYRDSSRQIVSSDRLGTFRLCSPGFGVASLNVHAKDFVALQVPLVMTPGEARALDVQLRPVRSAELNATLRIHGSDSAFRSGTTVQLEPMHRTIALDGPTTVVGGLPPGTIALHYRAIGSYPVDTLLTLEANAVTEFALVPRPVVTRLAGVNVKASSIYATSLKRELAIRRLLGGGTIIEAGDERLEHALVPTDVLWYAHGFQIGNDRVRTTRSYWTGGQMGQCESRSDSLRGMRIIVYLDGLRFSPGLEAIEREYKPSEILAVEAYPDVTDAPMQWRTGDACAVIAFWTKH